LRNLEKISNEIHEQRNRGKTRRELGERTAGVGEEQTTYTEFVSIIESNRFLSAFPLGSITTFTSQN
jgi:hypothetical protein